MVQTSQVNNLGPRPAVHLTLWKGSGKGVRDTLEPIYGVSSADGRTHRTHQLMGGAVPSLSSSKFERLGNYSSIGNAYAQQCPELHDKVCTKPTADRPRAIWTPRLPRNNPEPVHQGTHRSTCDQLKTHDPGPQ